jgi:hypothetical protein
VERTGRRRPSAIQLHAGPPFTTTLDGRTAMFGLFKKDRPPEPPKGPPIPKWKPTIRQPLEQVIDRVRYYTNGKRDFAVFTHGTCVIVTNGLSEAGAISEANAILAKIFHYHPDMNPRQMDDGNVGVGYNHPAINVVLEDVVKANWPEIEKNHLDALAKDEVLITPGGPNNFDDFGKKALFGRCFMFMDAQNPEVVRVVRAAV